MPFILWRNAATASVTCAIAVPLGTVLLIATLFHAASALADVLPSNIVSTLTGKPLYLTHIHGLAYSRDGSQIFIASHNGLAIYRDMRWSVAAGSADDLTGFGTTSDALYSSGYPLPGTETSNPLGLQKSRNDGATWEKLALDGQAALRMMAVAYQANVIYVFNAFPNALLEHTGFYFTRSDGKTWQTAAARGINIASAAHSLAVHPTAANVVAASTDTGLLVSEDFAGHFRHVYGNDFALSAWFDFDGVHLWLSHYGVKPSLTRLQWKDGKNAQDIALPLSDQTGVALIAQNPVEPSHIVIATFNRNVYLSNDQGQTWEQIVIEGYAGTLPPEPPDIRPAPMAFRQK